MKNRIVRALIIVENGSVPFDTRVWKEALSLRANGFDVTVLCPKMGSCVKTYEIVEGIRIYRHPMPEARGGPLGYFLEYGCALIWEWLFALWIYFRHGFDIIQGCNPPDTIVLVALPFKLMRVPYIFDHHDLSPELYEAKYGKRGGLYKLLCWFEALTFRSSDVVMSTNSSYAEIAVRRGQVPAEDVFVVRNGPDLKTFRPLAPDPALKYGKKYLIGYVGTMAEQEGLDILLRVAEHIRDLGRSDVHFTCVGSGPGLKGLRAMARELKVDDIVNFTGRISDEELLRVLSTADVCVNPDKPCAMNDMSTMIKIMEYMALGKPIVQFDLKEGKFSAANASLYADNDNPVSDFASKILWLLDHAEERAQMGAAGRKRVVEELAWEHSVNGLCTAYHRACEKYGIRLATVRSAE